MAVEVADDEAADKLIGEVLANRYQIESRLGEGAMGAVYRARHIKVGRPFAVKVLHARLTEDKKVLLRFEREAELAGRLRHPNVIGVVDVGETTDGMRYMVMDFAEGPDLASLLNEAPMPPQRIINLVRQLCEGLFHAHEHGLIHRDFKPENVIVERDTHGEEVPRIVDFGIAILREGSDGTGATGRLTTNGLVLGTPHYMAPEQAVADPIDHRIDLFALGIIVYEMLCSKLPFDGSGAEVARANLLLDPPLISERVPYLEVDPLLEAFARRLMAKKRDLRPPTAKAARDLLDLIDRDRAAAAASLGVPVGLAARPPMPTQPSTPVQTRNDHPGTFPPPVRGELATPPQAPAMGRAVAVAAPNRRNREHAISTSPADPLPFRQKSRRLPVLIVGGLALAAVGFIAAKKLMGSDDTSPAAPTVAQVETKTPAETKPDVSRPTESKPDETKPVEIKTPEVTNDTQIANATKDVAATKPTTVKPTTKPRHEDHKITKPIETKPIETKPIETKPIETKPIETKPIETKPPETHVDTSPQPTETKPLDANALVGLYRSVNSELLALENTKGVDAASDLRLRYRLITISSAMSTPDKIKETAGILTMIRREIASRK